MKFKGQSLTEILVALSIGVVFMNVGILAMATTNVLARINKANSYALSLLKSQSSILETISENGWHSIADLTIGKHYKLAKQNNSWVIQQGEDKAFDEKSPVAQWTFDEGAGNVVYDNVGANNGTLVNTPTWQSAPNCVNGSCLSFNGSNNYVDVADNVNLSPTSQISTEVWVKSSVGQAAKGILTKGPIGADYDYMLYMTSSGAAVSFYIKNSAGSSDFLPVTFNWADNLWHHYVATFDGQYLALYVDGVRLGYKSTSLSDIRDSNNDLQIGSGWGSYFNGLIDEPRIYDYALTDSQIKQHYNAGLNRLGLVSQWGLDEGSGTTAYDSQGSNDGTLVNSPAWKNETSCISGGCIEFSGSNKLLVSNPTNFTFTDEITIESWIYLNTHVNGWYSGIAGASPWAWELRVRGTNNPIPGQFDAVIYHPDTTVSEIYGTSYLGLGQWYHLAMTYKKNDAMRGYINGVSVPSTTNNVSKDIVINPTQLMMGLSNAYLNGRIDDVRIYNRALSTDEIANQYKDGYTKYFYINNVSRNIASDPTASTHNLETTYNADHDDPNTKKIINIARYLQGPSGRVNTEEQYLARVNSINSLIQTDWSGASGIDGPTIDFGNNYSSASNLTLSTAGQMSLTSTASNGSLISSIIDTQSIGGAGYFNILWQGTSCSSCVVKFQIAASNSMTGPWTYYGPTSTSDYYTPSGPGVMVPITYAGFYSANAASVQNKRYIRYQITLVPASSQSPVVKDVIINYAP